MAGPLVSIGLPTANGAAHLAEVLDTLTAQDHGEIEILVADNASTDATAEIVAAAAAREPRIRSIRHRVNIGQRENFNRVFQMSRGAYFLWASDHDLRAPDFISRLLAAFDGAPDLVLAYPGFQLLGETLDAPRISEGIDTRSLERVPRIWHVIRRNRTGMMIHGLFRSEALERTPLLQASPGAYRLLLTGLSLQGAVTEVADCTLSVRVLRRETAAEAERRRTEPEFGFWDPGDPWARHLPGLRMILGQLESIRGADIPAAEKRQLVGLLVREAAAAFPMLREEATRLGAARAGLDRLLGRDAFGLARGARLAEYATLAQWLFPDDSAVTAMRQAVAEWLGETSRQGLVDQAGDQAAAGKP